LWFAKPGTGDYLLAAALVVLAGADHDQLGHWIDVGRQRASAPMHSI
jgi:hypothetical protein